MKTLIPSPSFSRDEQVPLYEQVREHLREHCMGQEPNTALETVRELCESLGVNQSTVTRALRDLEADGLLRIIPRKGMFVASPPAVVELLVLMANNDSIGPVAQHFLTGMQAAHPDDGKVVAMSIPVPPFPDAEKFAQQLRLRQVAALAIACYDYQPFPTSLDEANFIYALSRRLPVVLVGKPHRWLKMDCVYCDPRPQIREWLENCYKMGVRRFGFVTSQSDAMIYQERFETFRQFLLEYNVGWHPEYVPDAEPADWPRHIAREKIMALIAADPAPEAVIVQQPNDAYTLLLEAHRRGLEPGRDIHILCLSGTADDLDGIAPYVKIVVLHEEEMGQRAMRRIQERLTNTGEPEPYMCRFPGNFFNPQVA